MLEWKIGNTWRDVMASVRGRHRGRLGALLVATPDGTTFSVGTGLTDAQREHPPAVGTLITFRFQELTDRGVPRFPSFVRTGSDVATACRGAGQSGNPPCCFDSNTRRSCHDASF